MHPIMKSVNSSVGLIHTSIPFSNHYEYTPSYNDFGHNEDTARFFEQMDYLTPELLRILQPGRVAAIHVKDRVLFGNVTGYGMPSMEPFHGLGGDSTLTVTTLADLDLVTANGTYQFTNGSATLYGINCRWAILRVTNYDSAAVMQELFPTGSTTRLVRYRNANVWDEWEVDNPPMIPGVEYRTTERWNGKVVYAKAIDCGALPNTDTKIVAWTPDSGSCTRVIGYGGTTIGYGALPNTIAGIELSVNNANIMIKTNADRSSGVAAVWVKYTKD